jgi:hypothetical protein
MKNHAWILGVAALGLSAAAAATQQQKSPGYDNTPMLPDGKWHVHDSKRPHPPIVTPGTSSTPETPGQAPSDAEILFDGKDLSKWKSNKGEAAGWKVENGYAEGNKTGDIQTRESFGDFQLHVEWMAPTPPKGDSQGRGNSGVFLHGRYEVQVLDSFDNVTYADGQASALYGQCPPLVNASRKPGEWQQYDIVFNAAKFKDGKLETPATATVFHNGVVVHNKKELLGPTQHQQLAKESAYDGKGPIRLQDHGNPVRFRNIWIRPLKGYDEP